jgi:6-phosphofructokinase 1
MPTQKKIRRIAVLTSGGDAPGMNACIRAVVRTALYHKLKVVGIEKGYDGLIDDQMRNMKAESVRNIIHRGGTILRSARSQRFRTDEGMQTAYENLNKRGIDGLIVIGGDGTFRGALAFSQKYDLPVIGIPGTIDNDLRGSDFTIGYDTALNTVVEAVDKIRDTAASHDRLFFIEVMGRDAGLIALRAGIAVGAEDILLPEKPQGIDKLIANLEQAHRRKKMSSIVIVAEGEKEGNVFELAKRVRQEMPDKYDVRVAVLGHIQRGGNPTCADRVLASRLGMAAVEQMIAGDSGQMVGIIDKKVALTPLESAVKHNSYIPDEWMRIVEILSI